MPSLSVSAIKSASSDDELYALLAAELKRLLGPGSDPDHERFLSRIRALPPGLRAMASVYELDVSLALDDLGMHFHRWHNIRLAEETRAGLKELGAREHAEAFACALQVAKRHWSFFNQPDFDQTYHGSPAEIELSPLNERLWTLQGYREPHGRSVLSYWVPYARQHPARVVGDA